MGQRRRSALAVLLLCAAAAAAAVPPAPVPPSPEVSPDASCSLTVRGYGGSTLGIKAAALDCSGAPVVVGLNSTLAPFAKSFTGIKVDKKLSCDVDTANYVWDFDLSKIGKAGKVKPRLYALLCFGGDQALLFDKLSIEDVNLDFNSSSKTFTTGLVMLRGRTQATFKGGLATRNQAGALLVLTDSSRAVVDGMHVSHSRAVSGPVSFPVDKSTLLIKGRSLMESNKGLRGGAILAGGSAKVTIADSTLRNNSVFEHGGVFYGHENSVLELQAGALLESNRANAESGYGGALCGDRASKYFIGPGVIIRNNSAAWGGCMDADKHVEIFISGATFEGNHANKGGCFYLEADSRCTMTDKARVIGNTASIGGGIFVMTSAQLNVSGASVVARNRADTSGGGLTVVNDGRTTLSGGASVVQNSAVDGAGAFTSHAALLTIQDARLSGNVAARNGGGIEATDASQVDLAAAGAITNNTALAGAAVWATGTTKITLNGTVTGNHAIKDGGAIFTTGDAKVMLPLDAGRRIYGNKAGRFGGGAALRNPSTTLEQLQAAVGGNDALYDPQVSPLATNLSLLSAPVVPSFVSRVGATDGILTTRLAVKGLYGLPAAGVLLQATVDDSENIVALNRTDADGYATLGLKLQVAPGWHSVKISPLQDVDTMGLGAKPVTLRVNVRTCKQGEVTASSNDACLVCLAGSYSLNPDANTCNECPAVGASCPGGATIVPLSGFWSSSPRSDQMHKCPNQLACQHNTSTVKAASASDAGFRAAQCSPGHTGNLCGMCEPGWGLMQPFHCRRCMEQSMIAGLYVLAACCLLATIKFQISLNRGETLQSNAASGRGGIKPTDIFKPLVLFMQWALLIFSMQVPWPGSLTFPNMVLAWLFSSASAQTLTIQCALHDKSALAVLPAPIVGVLFYLAMPVAMLAVLLVIDAALVYYKRWRTPPPLPPAACAEAAESPDPRVERAPSDRSLPDVPEVYTWHHTVSSGFVVIFMFYPFISRTVLSLFACVPIDSPVEPPLEAAAVGSFWVLQPDQQCFSGFHKAWALGLGIPLLLLIVGLPVAMALLLVRNKARLRDPTFFSFYNPLYKQYSSRCCYFEAVVMVQTLILVVISVFGLMLGPTLQALVMLIALLCFAALIILLRPMAHRESQHMMLGVVGCLVLLNYAALVFLALAQRSATPGSVASSSTPVSEAVGAIVLLAGLALGVLMLYRLVCVTPWRELVGRVQSTTAEGARTMKRAYTRVRTSFSNASLSSSMRLQSLGSFARIGSGVGGRTLRRSATSNSDGSEGSQNGCDAEVGEKLPSYSSGPQIAGGRSLTMSHPPIIEKPSDP